MIVTPSPRAIGATASIPAATQLPNRIHPPQDFIMLHPFSI
jgi:hypothetical protein